jgi:hypothetical protein
MLVVFWNNANHSQTMAGPNLYQGDRASRRKGSVLDFCLTLQLGGHDAATTFRRKTQGSLSSL